MSASPHSPIVTVPDRQGPAAAVRTAVLALFARMGAGPVIEDEAVRARLIDGMLPPSASLPRRAPVERMLRLRARAAYESVDGGGGAALDAALDVFADEVAALDRRVRNQAEALKAIRLYAPEPWVRRIAQQALVHPDRGAPAVPDFLGANELDDAEISVMAARYIG